ncbi:MAG: alpha/beta fold hydrolase [Acidimicrobiales bacterium]
MLLLHGFPQSSHQWRHQLPALGEAGYRAVAPDQRGYSPRSRPPDVADYAVDRLVADVLALAGVLGADRFHLVGHDWGGIVAWLVATRHPDRLISLTAVSTPHPAALLDALRSPSTDQAARSAYVKFLQTRALPELVLLAAGGAGLRALFAWTGGVEPSAVDEYVALLSQPGALTAALNWYRALDLDTGDAFRPDPVRVPTLYVWSTDDPALGREAAEATASHMDGPYRFVELDGVSHWVPEDAPDKLTRLLLEHLAAA